MWSPSEKMQLIKKMITENWWNQTPINEILRRSAGTNGQRVRKSLVLIQWPRIQRWIQKVHNISHKKAVNACAIRWLRKSLKRAALEHKRNPNIAKAQRYCVSAKTAQKRNTNPFNEKETVDDRILFVEKIEVESGDFRFTKGTGGVCFELIRTEIQSTSTQSRRVIMWSRWQKTFKVNTVNELERKFVKKKLLKNKKQFILMNEFQIATNFSRMGTEEKIVCLF